MERVRPAAELSEEEAERWAAHLEAHLGASSTVFHELVSDAVHIDVLVFAPRAGRPFQVLVTQGMSALPMSVPEGAEALTHAELLIALPPDWKLDGDGSDDETLRWPMSTLRFIARLPHSYATWIGFGHTIPNGAPPAPYAPDTALCGAIVGDPVALPESIRTCEIAPGKTVNLYALFPIHEDEMSFKLEHGAAPLFRRMARRAVDEVVRPARRSALARRFRLR